MSSQVRHTEVPGYEEHFMEFHHHVTSTVNSLEANGRFFIDSLRPSDAYMRQ